MVLITGWPVNGHAPVEYLSKSFLLGPSRESEEGYNHLGAGITRSFIQYCGVSLPGNLLQRSAGD